MYMQMQNNVCSCGRSVIIREFFSLFAKPTEEIVFHFEIKTLFWEYDEYIVSPKQSRDPFSKDPVT